MEHAILKILIPATTAFVIGILISPIITSYLYKYKVWKKCGGKTALYGKTATVFNKLKGDEESKTPRMGGIVIWSSVFLTTLLLVILHKFTDIRVFDELYFLSRSQTWIPLTAMLVGAGVGFLNDFYDVTHQGCGLKLRVRILIITALATAIGWWFYSKLGVDAIGIPFTEDLYVGIFLIPFFVILTIGLYASGIIDGIDGLSGGVFASVFISYSGVAYIQQQFDIAALSATIAGATLAFLWFNIPPARFWMTETGTMALTLALSVIVLMTDHLGGGHGIFLVMIICLPLVATVGSNVIQMGYRKATGKKFFEIAPLHHHFEAIGWPSYKVTMRYWVISIICAILGIIIAGLAL